MPVRGWSSETRGTEGWAARCSCGLRSGRFYPNDDPALDAEPDDVDQRIYAKWRDTHMAPLVDPDKSAPADGSKIRVWWFWFGVSWTTTFRCLRRLIPLCWAAT